MEALLIVVVAGIMLLVPVGSLLGFLAFRASGRQTSRIAELDKELAQLRHELAYLKAEPPIDDPEEEPSLDLDLEPVPEPMSRQPDPIPRPVTSSEPEEPPRDDSPKVPEPTPVVSLENRLLAALKENWMVWLGALSVSLAGIFMVSHSITSGLIGPVQQFLLALLVGLALHAGAEFLRRRHMGTDQVFAALAGGGSVTLYAALLAGVHLFELLGPATALVALAVVSLITMLLALVHGPLLAVMGLSGAYVVPILVGGEDGGGAFLLGYSFVITLSSLLLMRYVFRLWLWYATVSGALLWWLLVIGFFSSDLSAACYLSALFVLFSILPGAPRVPVRQCAIALMMLLLAWAASITLQPLADPTFAGWLILIPIAVVTPMSRGLLWFLPWAAVLATFAGWLGYAGRGHSLEVLTPLDTAHHGAFLAYLGMVAVATTLPAFWRWQQQVDLRRWASLVLVSPVVWLVLGWLLTNGGAPSVPWAIFTLLAGGVYGGLAWFMDRNERYRAGLVWALLAAHACYSLAVVMWLQEASLTLALAAQFVSLVLLARRYQAPELYLLLKAILAVVVARLTFNPWLDNYEASVHWTLLTYGGVALSSAIATWLTSRDSRIRLWLEGATLHFVVLFLGAVLRYWLYDGEIFIQSYGLTEAAINTALWGALSVVYVVRAQASVSMAWFYRLLARILLVLAGLSYLTVITVNNPWWQMDLIGDTPVFNLLLLAYGAPVLLALAHARFSDLVPKLWAQCGAAAAFLLFTALEIRQLWQGSEIAYWYGVSEGELYTYSIVGMGYAIAAILWSIRRNSEWLHKGGMALLGVVIAKIFLVDMSGLQGLWRVAAFMGLGLALLGLAWMYRRTRKTEGPAAAGE
ncbi:DUF2339 domain-containing protein [Marinobacter sp. LN3S78]|uniref:DUF2339 domain-containing protein n=1 Tax=Marinobacter sp. LN3S78 TaxID=3382300 RepID=UPI00387B40EB